MLTVKYDVCSPRVEADIGIGERLGSVQSSTIQCSPGFDPAAVRILTKIRLFALVVDARWMRDGVQCDE